jgi:hypothetical protein
MSWFSLLFDLFETRRERFFSSRPQWTHPCLIDTKSVTKVAP